MSVKRLQQWGTKTLLSVLVIFGSSFALRNPVQATEKISFRYGFLGRSISVSALEAFAREGTVDSSLRWYLEDVDPETQEEIRQALVISQDVLSPSELSQLLHTPMGEDMLTRTGRFILTGSGQNGSEAIRGALVVAATDPEGLSLLTFLKAFPTSELRIDLDRIVAEYRQASKVISQIDNLLASVKQTSETMAAQSPLDKGNLVDLRAEGPHPVNQETLMLEDFRRERSFPADLYYPADFNGIQGDIPVIIMSHGLGSTRDLFSTNAAHLASYGYFVVTPEHIDSNKDQQNAVLSWLEDELFKVSEFVNRPQDISFLLDELEQRNASEFDGRLNFDRVAAIGHSFGGYTVLALAGATIDFDRLDRLCGSDEAIIEEGLALLLSCRSQELLDSPETVEFITKGGLRDERISSVVTFNPVSNLFGKTGMSRIQIPVLMAGGVDDIAAPILTEQAEPFSWLTTPEKYLLVAERVSHNEELTKLIDQTFYAVNQSDEAVALDELDAKVNALLVAFSEIYLKGNETYRPFLSSAYLGTISQSSLPLHMTSDLDPSVLPETVE